MTPQAFSFPTLGNNGIIYIPPYGLKESINFMLRLDPKTYEIKKIPLIVDNSFEKWQYGVVVKNKIVFLPYNEKKILVLDTTNDFIEYIDVPFNACGKYVKAHVHNNTIISLPYGEGNVFNQILSFNLDTKELRFKEIFCEIDDEKKWHTSQYLDGKIYAVPRGEKWDPPYFSFSIELDCDSLEYKLIDMSSAWVDYDLENFTNKKYTTLAKVGNKLYAPPYSENPNFDILLIFDKEWYYKRLGIKSTSRKYYNHTVSKNGKIYCPPAGHEEEWADMLVIDSMDDSWKTVSTGIGKESKKYFTGWENSRGKIYYIPRGGCVCMPKEEWKLLGDLVEVLVVDTNDDSVYTIDISQHFTDSSTIEKYNGSLIYEDKIFAFPYGQSEEFQTLLIFDTITEEVVHNIDLNGI
jgi:hypothetical protein